jgi:hypothetical protein
MEKLFLFVEAEVKKKKFAVFFLFYSLQQISAMDSNVKPSPLAKT